MSAPGNKRAVDGGRADWETPPALFDSLDLEFQFTLDGAADEQNHKVDAYYSEEMDAFLQQPDAEVIFCNPPYGDGLKDWIDLFSEWGVDNTVVALLPNATDTEWFWALTETAHEIRLLKGRVQFVGTTSSNPSGSIVVIWRPSRRPPSPYIWVWDWKHE